MLVDNVAMAAAMYTHSQGGSTDKRGTYTELL